MSAGDKHDSEAVPIPIEELERHFPPRLGFRVGHGTYYFTDENGKPQKVPTTFVEAPDGSRYTFLPKASGD